MLPEKPKRLFRVTVLWLDEPARNVTAEPETLKSVMLTGRRMDELSGPLVPAIVSV